MGKFTKNSGETRSDKKRSPGFEKKREEETRDDTAELATKNRGVTPSVAAPGVTHPSDATAFGENSTDGS